MDYQGEFTGPQIDALLTLAGSAYQKPATGIPATDLAEYLQLILNNAYADHIALPGKQDKSVAISMGDPGYLRIDNRDGDDILYQILVGRDSPLAFVTSNKVIIIDGDRDDISGAKEKDGYIYLNFGGDIDCSVFAIRGSIDKVSNVNSIPSQTTDVEISFIYHKPASGIPASDLAEGVIPDVSGFITKNVNDLVNYYLKSDTYTKEEVQELIGQIVSFRYEIAPSTSSVTNPQNNVLYLIGPTGTGSDKYEEYVYPNSETGWVKIGDTSIDLTGYVTMEALNAVLANYQTIANLVSAFSATPSNENYPSEKLVYDSMFVRGVISQTQTWTLAADGGYDYVMSNLVQGDIPKANIDLFEAAGATFNAVTGYFELNGLTDISYEEMQRISEYQKAITYGLYYRFQGANVRTNLPEAWFGRTNPNEKLIEPNTTFIRINGFAYESDMEVALFPPQKTGTSVYFKPTTLNNICRQTNYLKSCLNVIDVSSSFPQDSFYRAYNLEDVRIFGLKTNTGLAFQESLRLSVASILYMINNEAATSPIVITLHATAYARAMADADIQTALTNHPNVSLASA